jgi:hypothetical protein
MIKIKTISIDEFCNENNIQKIDLIKLDIEGQELEAIKGSTKILKKNPQAKIIFELNIAKKNNGIKYAKKIFNILKKKKFIKFELLVDKKITIKDLNNYKDLEVLKKVTSRYNVNILASR